MLISLFFPFSDFALPSECTIWNEEKIELLKHIVFKVNFQKIILLYATRIAALKSSVYMYFSPDINLPSTPGSLLLHSEIT